MLKNERKVHSIRFTALYQISIISLKCVSEYDIRQGVCIRSIKYMIYIHKLRVRSNE